MLFPKTACALTAVTCCIALSTGSAGAFFQPGYATSPRAAESMVGAKEGRIVLAQASDPRIAELQEQVRRLNGQVEELNFQILQMQEQMRLMQEDNEFRFQQLEGGSSEVQDSTAVEPAERSNQPDQGATTGTAERVNPEPESGGQGEPPRALGSITFDDNGNIVSSNPGEPLDLLGNTDGSTVAALPNSNDPERIYRNAYEFILSGDYDTAEAGFRQYLDQFPDGAHAADAHFWLGEALLAQERHREAAEVFLEANRSFPSANKAPDMLLKLGVSLAAIGQHDVACATFTEMEQRYPEISSALSDRVRMERASVGC
ncbi:tol-pal system protein YbgF [Chelativorans sp. YIM 93263]|uniref:tol-pal system protein YbgF n=1 Tax=Chelativorans sp. YIM 93263 TaxID=2906648 RepID=UPI0023797694|nr:tol-pal system protein YbgF [Chelativorans sp. YIM 93263]